MRQRGLQVLGEALDRYWVHPLKAFDERRRLSFPGLVGRGVAHGPRVGQDLFSPLLGQLGADVAHLVLWYRQRILKLLEKIPSMAFTSPGAPSEVTEGGTLKPRPRFMSLKNSVQHSSDSLFPTAKCKSTLRPSVVSHQAARTPSLAPYRRRLW